MVKVRVHIAGEGLFMDKNVFVEISLPAVPRIGDSFHLIEDMIDHLEKMAKSDIDIACQYFPKWFYRCPLGEKIFNGCDLEDLSFSDAVRVSDVLFTANSEIIDIELDN